MMALEHILSNGISDTDAVGCDYMIKDVSINKEKYVDWVDGPFWNSYLMWNQFVDALIYLLFLGVTQITHKLVIKWIQMSKRTKAFNFATEVLLKYMSVMGLDQCKV